MPPQHNNRGIAPAYLDEGRRFKEDDPDTVGKMIDFCYNYDYDRLSLTFDGEYTSSMSHARMYLIADKYHISLLRDLARKEFKDDIQGSLRPERVVNLIEAVYENTVSSDRDLKHYLPSVLNQYKSELRRKLNLNGFDSIWWSSMLAPTGYKTLSLNIEDHTK